MTARVLVVDTYAPNRLIYREWLAQIEGLEIVEAANLAHALQLARDTDFALFLVDINLRSTNGFDLAAMLAAEPRAQLTPIVFVTSEITDNADVIQGYRAGAVDVVLSAPTRGEIILQKARFYVRVFQQRQELDRRVKDSRAAASELSARLSARAHDESGTRATHDALTHLPNRHLFRDRLLGACARSARSSQPLAVCHVALDNFEAVNDQHHYSIGDVLLPAVAQRLTGSLRTTDTVARFGASEFGLILEGLTGSADAERVASKLHETLTAPYSLDVKADPPEPQLHIDVSIGLAVFPEHATEIDGLLVLADMAKESVKREGGGVRLYASSLTTAGLPARLRLKAKRTEEARRH